MQEMLIVRRFFTLKIRNLLADINDILYKTPKRLGFISRDIVFAGPRVTRIGE